MPGLDELNAQRGKERLDRIELGIREGDGGAVPPSRRIEAIRLTPFCRAFVALSRSGVILTFLWEERS